MVTYQWIGPLANGSKEEKKYDICHPRGGGLVPTKCHTGKKLIIWKTMSYFLNPEIGFWGQILTPKEDNFSHPKCHETHKKVRIFCTILFIIHLKNIGGSDVRWQMWYFFWTLPLAQALVLCWTETWKLTMYSNLYLTLIMICIWLWHELWTGT